MTWNWIPGWAASVPPRTGAWVVADWEGGWTCCVEQGAYGHRARKATWLYAVGPKPADLDWSDPEPEATVSFLTNHGGGDLPRLSKKEAKSTPLAFRDALLAIARSCAKHAEAA